MIELFCEYLSVPCFWLHVIIMSDMSLRVNPHSIVCRNFNELLVLSIRYISSLSDSHCVGIWNQLLDKWTPNHLAKLVQRLRCVLSIDPYSAFDCMLLSCNVHVSEWIYFLYLPECQRTSCSKQAPYLNFNWQQPDSNLRPLSL